MKFGEGCRAGTRCVSRMRRCGTSRTSASISRASARARRSEWEQCPGSDFARIRPRACRLGLLRGPQRRPAPRASNMRPQRPQTPASHLHVAHPTRVLHVAQPRIRSRAPRPLRGTTLLSMCGTDGNGIAPSPRRRCWRRRHRTRLRVAWSSTGLQRTRY